MSDSKAWALFVVDATDATAATLHRVLPELHTERAFEHVTKSLTRMYAPTVTKDTTWSSSTGLHTPFLCTFLTHFDDQDAAAAVEPAAFLRNLHDVVDRIVTVCKQRNLAGIEDVLNDDVDLRKAFETLFTTAHAVTRDPPRQSAQNDRRRILFFQATQGKSDGARFSFRKLFNEALGTA